MRALALVLCVCGTAWADDKVTQTSVFDFQLVERDSSFVVRDPAFEITFPAKPIVSTKTAKTPEGTDLTTASVAIDHGNSELMLFLAVPWPADQTLRIAGALNDMRDGGLRSAHATMISDTPTTIAGAPGRHVVGTFDVGGRTMRVDQYLQWDEDHRLELAWVTTTPGSTESPASKALVGSFKRIPGTYSPLDAPLLPHGVAKATGVLDLELVRTGDTYVLQNSMFEASFPMRPALDLTDMKPGTLVLAMGTLGAADDLDVAYQVFADADIDVEKEQAAFVGSLLEGFDKIVGKKSVRAKVGGRDGTRITFTGKVSGLSQVSQMDVAWSPEHHAFIAMLAQTTGKKLGAKHLAFLRSLVLK